MARAYRLKEDVVVEFKDKQSQKDVAELLGISETHLSLVLNGKKNASKMLAMSISTLNRYGSVDYFFEAIK